MTIGSADATLVVPEDWWKIPLHPLQRRQAAIRALAARQFRGLDNQPILRRGLEDELSEVAGEAAEHYGVVMYVSRQVVEGMPLPMSLVVRHLPAQLGTMEQLHERLTGEEAVDTAELPAGRCLRRTRAVRPAKDGYENGQPAITLDYWFEAPGDRGLMQLTFSSPLFMLAEALTQLFDAVVSTLSWTESNEDGDG